MAAIYNADIWCDDCADDIRDRLCDVYWAREIWDVCPDGTPISEFSSRKQLDAYLRGMDERHYDSDEYPKFCSDDEESDGPQHCAALGDCVNPTALSDGSKIGFFFGNSLTSYGVEYVKESVYEDLEHGCEDSVAIEIWMDYYDWIDWGNIGHCDVCGELAILDDDELCGDCTQGVDTDDCEG
jgi:hypothetical protein